MVFFALFGNLTLLTLGEFEKTATHYRIVCGGKMIAETTAEALNANFIHVIMTLACGALFAVGLGAVSYLILNKTNAVKVRTIQPPSVMS